MNPEWKFLVDTVIRWLPYIAIILLIPFAVLLVRCMTKGACRNGPVQKLNSFADEEFWIGDQDYLKDKRQRLEALKTENIQKHKSLPHLPVTSQSEDVFKSVNLTADPSGHSSVEPAPTANRIVCSICRNAYNESELINNLPCSHHFHHKCADDWFTKHDYCPQCIRPNKVIQTGINTMKF